MIKSIWIDNFKSLVDFKLDLAKFNCIIGLNGSGKSTLLQALDFLSQLIEGDLNGWLSNRQWKVNDLNSKLVKRSNIEFKVELELHGRTIAWFGSFNRSTLRCTKESVTENGYPILLVEDGHYTIDLAKREIVFSYEGSILSVLREILLKDPVKQLKYYMLGIRSLDLISPELLRTRTRSSDGRLGLGGQNMSALIHEQQGSPKKLLDALSRAYPQLAEIRTRSLRSGWKELVVTEQFGSKKMTSAARHVNDGMLRLMAVMLQLQLGDAFLLFDEIENGINPELVEYLMDSLVESQNQILVTTHSPMVLNFLDDTVARDGVIYLYKTSQGMTKAVRFFDIPSVNKKLDFMGPGEAFVDTDLLQLKDEIISVFGRDI